MADIGSRFRCITASSVTTVTSTSSGTSQPAMSCQKVVMKVVNDMRTSIAVK